MEEILKCDCCEWFGQESKGEIKFCRLCNKYFCDACRHSPRRMEYFIQYWLNPKTNRPTKLVFDGEIPKPLNQYAEDKAAF